MLSARISRDGLQALGSARWGRKYGGWPQQGWPRRVFEVENIKKLKHRTGVWTWDLRVWSHITLPVTYKAYSVTRCQYFFLMHFQPWQFLFVLKFVAIFIIHKSLQLKIMKMTHLPHPWWSHNFHPFSHDRLFHQPRPHSPMHAKLF